MQEKIEMETILRAHPGIAQDSGYKGLGLGVDSQGDQDHDDKGDYCINLQMGRVNNIGQS
jgi:hypothetical protein